MIKKLELENFQSHKKTALEFSPGVNAIVGTSDSGKSAVLRSLFWVVENKPDGADFVSTFAGKNPAIVSVTSDNGVVTRERNAKTLNKYTVNGREMAAFGREVPPDVTEILQVYPVNIQKQLDSPFLLSDSAGEVARKLNAIVNLDVIDRALSKIESSRRAIKSEIKVYTEQYSEKLRELEKYGFIADFEKDLSFAEKLENNVKNVTQKMLQMKPLLQGVFTITETLEALPDFSDVNLSRLHSQFEKKQKIEKIRKELENVVLSMKSLSFKITAVEGACKIDVSSLIALEKKQSELIKNFTTLSGICQKYGTVKTVLGKLPDFSEVNFSRLENSAGKLPGIKAKLEKIESFLFDIGKISMRKSNKKTELAQLEAEYQEIKPDSCPLCGGVL